MAQCGSMKLPAHGHVSRTSAGSSMLPPPSQPNIISPPATSVRPSASAARWVCSGAETSSASASLRTAAQVQDQWRSALAASIGGDAVSQRDSSLRELLQVAVPCLRRRLRLRVLTVVDDQRSKPPLRWFQPTKLDFSGGCAHCMPRKVDFDADTCIRRRPCACALGGRRASCPTSLATGLMAFYSTQLQPSEHRAFFELLTSAFGCNVR